MRRDDQVEWASSGGVDAVHSGYLLLWLASAELILGAKAGWADALRREPAPIEVGFRMLFWAASSSPRT